MITHRPDVLKQVDKVIVINNGQVEDMGNHEELYERNEFYRQMVNIPDGVTVYDEMPHDFQVLIPQLEQSQKAWNEIKNFIEENI